MKSKSRFLFLADGPSIHTKRLMKYFKNRGYKIDIITFRSVQKHLFNNIYHIDVGEVKEQGNNFQYILALPEIYKIIKGNEYNMVLAIYLTSYGFIASLFFDKFYLYVFGTDIKVTARKNICFCRRFLK